MSYEYDWAYDEENRIGRRLALDALREGGVVESAVTNLIYFGAFVDLGAIEGLIHISELPGETVNLSGEVVRVGDRVRVEVLEVDRERERVYLGLEQVLEEGSR